MFDGDDDARVAGELASDCVGRMCRARRALPTSFGRRDVAAALDGIRFFAAAIRHGADRRRLALRVRAVADQIDGARAVPATDVTYDLAEVICDALLPLSVDVNLDLPEHQVVIVGDREAMERAVFDVAAEQAMSRDRIWISLRADRTGARLSIVGNGRVERVSALARLIIKRAGGHVLPLGDAVTLLVPYSASPQEVASQRRGDRNGRQRECPVASPREEARPETRRIRKY